MTLYFGVDHHPGSRPVSEAAAARILAADGVSAIAADQLSVCEAAAFRLTEDAAAARRLAMPIKENGPWEAGVNESGEVYIASDDFTHDVVLSVSGDFWGEQERLAYAEEIARRLNAATPKPSLVASAEDTRSLDQIFAPRPDLPAVSAESMAAVKGSVETLMRGRAAPAYRLGSTDGTVPLDRLIESLDSSPESLGLPPAPFATIKDLSAMARLDPERVAHVLASWGWRQAFRETSDLFLVMDKEQPGAPGRRQVKVPSRVCANFAEGMADLIARVAEVDGQSPLQIYVDLLGEAITVLPRSDVQAN